MIIIIYIFCNKKYNIIEENMNSHKQIVVSHMNVRELNLIY